MLIVLPVKLRMTIDPRSARDVEDNDDHGPQVPQESSTMSPVRPALSPFHSHALDGR